MDVKRSQPIGIELVRRGIVTEADIDKALDYQKRHPKKKIGDILDILKQIYDCIFLKKIFKGNQNTSISSLMVKYYNKHREDLYFLKELFRKNRSRKN